jgi:hypothetical protein
MRFIFHHSKEQTLEILKEHASPILHPESDDEVEDFMKNGPIRWAKPYPALDAIANVFQLAVRRNPEIAGFNPWFYGIVTTSGPGR